MYPTYLDLASALDSARREEIARLPKGRHSLRTALGTALVSLGTRLLPPPAPVARARPSPYR